MARLDSTIAIVSGVGSGMGLQHARSLVAEGARVLGFDLTEGQAPTLLEELGAEHFAWIVADVTSQADWARVVATCERSFGTPTLLVNNAGIARSNRVDTATEAEYRRVLDVNQVGPFLGMQAVIEPMRRGGGGSIVNVCSTAGLVGFVDNFAYVAAKWALRGMTKAAALELASDRIRVNAIFPGEVDTPLLRADPTALPPASSRMRRWARPHEISAAVVFLASAEASYVSGSDVTIDGLHTAG